MYVVNKLIAEVENARDAKTRVTALSKLGEIDGVDAFKKRTEMTVRVQPIEEVEKELLETLSNIESKVIDVEAREIVFGDRSE
jgi:predicted HAD superfamily phosphohydrolase